VPVSNGLPVLVFTIEAMGSKNMIGLSANLKVKADGREKKKSGR
jgi:hypothetical protein